MIRFSYTVDSGTVVRCGCNYTRKHYCNKNSIKKYVLDRLILTYQSNGITLTKQLNNKAYRAYREMNFEIKMNEGGTLPLKQKKFIAQQLLKLTL